MGPITWVLVGAGVLLGASGGYFLAPKKDDSTEIAEAMEGLTEAVSRPLVLDAETRANLSSDVPAGCLDAATSLTPACLAAACWRYQQSDAGRSDASTCAELLDDARIQSWVSMCGGDSPDWACVDLAIKAAREQD